MARILTGRVVSDKTNKTIVVNVQTRKTHPIYKKQYIVSHKFMAHDEANEAHEGDLVQIVETKPISARKRFTLDKVTEKAAIRHIDESDTDSQHRATKKRSETDNEEVEEVKAAKKPAAKKATKKTTEKAE